MWLIFGALKEALRMIREHRELRLSSVCRWRPTGFDKRQKGHCRVLLEGLKSSGSTNADGFCPAALRTRSL